MRKVLDVIWGVWKRKYFCKGDSTQNCPTGKSPRRREPLSCPGRAAALFALLRRAGTHIDAARWTPAQQRTAARCAADPGNAVAPPEVYQTCLMKECGESKFRSCPGRGAARRAGCSRRRNPPSRRGRMADYAGACHRAAPCADPLGSIRPTGCSDRCSNYTRRLQLLDHLGAIPQRSQHLVIVFAEVGRRGADLAIKTCDLAGLRHQIDFAEAGVRDRALDAQRFDLRVGKRVLDVVDRAAGKTRGHDQFEPLAGGLCAQGGGNRLVQRLPVSPPQRSRGKARIGGHLLAVDDLTEFLEILVAGGGEVEKAVGGGKKSHRRVGGMV